MLKRKEFAKITENEFDFTFSAEIQKIDSIEEFEANIISPYNEGRKIFYRGERKNSITRPLLPSIFRNREGFFHANEKVTAVNNQTLYDYYKNCSLYFELYENILGKINIDEMYSFLAFSQHYFGTSPLIDFTKSPYVALSFALKDRVEYDENILFYTLELKNQEDYTADIDTANKWIDNYSVLIFNNVTKLELDNPIDALYDFKIISEKFKGHRLLEITSPSAKLIDVPTNDLMKYQQGVFLLLDDFSLVGKSYFTKKIRDDFTIKKWIVNKSICPALLERLNKEKPYYAYKSITNLSGVVSQIKQNTNTL